MNAKYYFENAELHTIPAVFSRKCIEGSQRLKEQYGEQETHEVIYETVLTEPEATCDISFRVDTGKKPVGNYWLEFDYAVYSSGDETALTPCKFLDASCLKPNRDQEEVRLFLKQDLTALVGQDKAALLAPSLLDVEDKRREPCLGCRYENYCLPCTAVGSKLQGEFTYGLAACELGQRD